MLEEERGLKNPGDTDRGLRTGSGREPAENDDEGGVKERTKTRMITEDVGVGIR